ncbi:MAG TPA: hypothetical protein VIM57_08495 [Luteolibacter sp.]
MKLKHIALWLAVMTVGFVFGRYALAYVSSPDVMSIVLMACGALFSAATSLSWAVQSKYDQAPPKELSEKNKARYRRKMDYRRKVGFWRYGLSVTVAITAAVCGAVLKFARPVQMVPELIGVGIASLAAAILLAILAVHEFYVISKATRDLPIELERRARKKKALEKLGESAKDLE